MILNDEKKLKRPSSRKKIDTTKNEKKKKKEIIQKPKKNNVPYFLLTRFLVLKLIIFVLAHFSLWALSSNSYSGELVLFENANLNWFDGFLKRVVRPFINWDAVHMVAIARYGYVFENQFAFFPLLPIGSRFLALFLLNWCGLKSFLSIEALASAIALVVVNSCHYFAALMLYKLTILLFKSSKFALFSALIFIFNPASIQLSSFYTEAPFAFLTFSGLYQFYRGNHFFASLLWALASATRSNGIVLIGFFFYNLLEVIFDYFRKEGERKKRNKNIFLLVKTTLLTLIYSLISISTFLAFLAFGYDEFCNVPIPMRPWCKYRIPNIYSFVQKQYWNVGLFNYFRFKQIPNFLFALPMILICSSACFLYFEADHMRFISLGMNRQQRKKQLKCFMNDAVLPHIYLLIFMLFYNVFIAHVQIITRLFTFMPVVYWFMAHVMMNYSERVQENLQTYIGLYGLIGVVLFALHYPPA